MSDSRKPVVITGGPDAILNDQVSFIDTDLNTVADQGKDSVPAFQADKVKSPFVERSVCDRIAFA